MKDINPPAIYGEAVAGESAKIKNNIESLVKGLNTSTFDLADLLFLAKTKNFISQWGFNTMGEYFESINLKVSKGRYLVKIAETMAICQIPRSEYESVGTNKLRAICKIDPLKEYQGKGGAEYVKGLVENANSVSVESIKEAVESLQGKTAEDADTWLNISVKRAARDNTIRPAIETMKKLIGSVAKNEDGNSVDASDGRALELICADFNSGHPEEA